jgi:biotin carboxylase
MPVVKCKSKMKDRYHAAGIPVALYHLVDDKAGCKAFIEEVGYPVIVKPDNGVGAINTFRIKDEADLDRFFAAKDDTQYIMEELIDGTVVSYDAIVNSKGDILIEAGNLTPGCIMDLVNEQQSCRVVIRSQLPEPLRDMGRAALKAFGVRQRMVHFEFFQLNSDQRIGKAGDYAGLEVNMRPCGGILPSMINYAYSTDVYQIWADMLVRDKSEKTAGTDRQFCAFAGRRDARSYVMSNEDIRRTYGPHLKEEGPVDKAMAVDMGNYMFIATFPTLEEVNEFYRRTLEEK